MMNLFFLTFASLPFLKMLLEWHRNPVDLHQHWRQVLYYVVFVVWGLAEGFPSIAVGYLVVCALDLEISKHIRKSTDGLCN